MPQEDDFDPLSKEAVEQTMARISSMPPPLMGECIELHLGALIAAMRLVMGDACASDFLRLAARELDTEDEMPVPDNIGRLH